LEDPTCPSEARDQSAFALRHASLVIVDNSDMVALATPLEMALT